MSITKLLAALKATGIPFAADAWTGGHPNPPYGVVAVDGVAETLGGDGLMVARTWEGTVDLFVEAKYQADFAVVECTLRGCEGLRWALNTRQYEYDTGLVHYEWVVRWLDEGCGANEARN